MSLYAANAADALIVPESTAWRIAGIRPRSAISVPSTGLCDPSIATSAVLAGGTAVSTSFRAATKGARGARLPLSSQT